MSLAAHGKGRVSELEDESTEIIQIEIHKENIMEEKEQHIKTCGTQIV